MGMRWRHVRTHKNPADLVSRGVSPNDLVDNQLWWHGPNWLLTPKENWPLNRMDVDVAAISNANDLEHRRIVQANVCVRENEIIHLFSSYRRLIRFTAVWRRFIQYCKRDPALLVGPLTADERRATQRFWLLKTQQQHYYDELSCLGKAVPEPIHHKSKLLSLHRSSTEMVCFG